ncbi:MAG: hypothetical protein OXE50_10580, partial [Chloroflexi bacterium]|nr:hypothetical protein [Chloroflexota bacterium]
GEWLLESGLAETKAFLRTFVKEIVVRPGRATNHYAVPTPEDSPIGGADVAEVGLGRRFMKSVSRGEPVEPRSNLPDGGVQRGNPRCRGRWGCCPQAFGRASEKDRAALKAVTQGLLSGTGTEPHCRILRMRLQ